MSPTTANSERRKNQRKRPPSLIYVELSATNGGMMRDLSEEGFALRAMMPLRPGERTSFSFLLNESMRIEGEGETIWVEDKGRLAGIRFTQLPPEASKEIRGWLNGVSDAPESKESEEEPVAPAAQTFDQLREELHSAPPRGESAKSGKPRWPIPPAGSPTAPVQNEAPEANAGAKLPEMHVATSRKPVPAEEPKHSVEPIPFPIPTLPDFSPNRDNAGSFFESTSASREPAGRDAHSQRGSRHVPLPTFSEEGEVSRPPAELPDISKILMQPSRKAAEHGTRPPVLEPLDGPGQIRGAFAEPKRRGFTLSRAVLTMFVLACVVASAVYHETLGQGLIWLGNQMGGSTVSVPATTSPAVPNPETSNPEAAVPVTKPSDSPAAAQNPGTSEAKQDNPNSETAHPSNSPAAVPAVTSNPPPPVTPLSEIANPATSESSPESGLTEYAKAQQLLHGKNGVTDPSEAVRLLWISVEKGNPSAELTLAELYWHGEGVARNCDQTRILLSAAARKGNADAQKRLQQFEREGCE